MFVDTTATILSQRSKLWGNFGQVTEQKCLAHWMQLNSQLLKHVQKVTQADDSLRARMTHLSECEITGIYARFDLPAEKCARFRPTVFLGNILSMAKTEFSAIQLGQYLLLILGLEFPQQQASNARCYCGRPNDSSGNHRLNCSRWASRS